jgi:hypothetical protein
MLRLQALGPDEKTARASKGNLVNIPELEQAASGNANDHPNVYGPSRESSLFFFRRSEPSNDVKSRQGPESGRALHLLLCRVRCYGSLKRGGNGSVSAQAVPKPHQVSKVRSL